MTDPEFHAHALRVAKARLAQRTGHFVERLFWIVAFLIISAGLAVVAMHHHQGFSLTGIGVVLLTAAVWIRWDLRELSPLPIAASAPLDDRLPPEMVAWYEPTLTAAQLWSHLITTFEAKFIVLRLGLDPSRIAAAVATYQLDHTALMQAATDLASSLGLPRYTDGLFVGALFHLVPELQSLATTAKLTLDDINEGVHWVARYESYLSIRRPIYGGLARDWASGYTPQLSRFGSNLSQQVEFAGRHFHTQERTNQLDTLITDLNSATGSVVLIGEPGIGKTALLLGLADRLLQGKEAANLKHYQIYSLSASTILSGTTGPGDIERIVSELFNEAVHAGNIVVALDEAQLFFGEGTGSVNLSRLLLPILQSRRVKLVLALTPGDWQKLRATNTSMAGLLTPLVMVEPGQTEAMRVLADRALLIEPPHCMTTYQALQEAYRLAGRYLQDEAYPGKALKLLEAAMNHPDGAFISSHSVQQAVESQFGVKVTEATQAESDVLLHLEDKIHQRMINQSRAVSVVSNALRRARAGVSNPKRPIGSFLFLGPTGVGKTELAKSIAALYFGREANLIRLDMSEYQQVADVDRILESASTNSEALLPKVRQSPFSVVLFDEIEKAHANILNLFLQLLDEGNLTDTSGKPTSFKDAIIIATSNAGADDIRHRIEAGQQLESFETEFTNSLISSGTFKPELLNRFDEIVLFRPLNQQELGQVVVLMLAEVNKTLETQKIKVELAEDAIAELVKVGYDPRLGARPMRRMVQRRVEDTVAGLILRGEAKPGDTIKLAAAQLGPSQPGERPDRPQTDAAQPHTKAQPEQPAPSAAPAAKAPTPPTS